MTAGQIAALIFDGYDRIVGEGLGDPCSVTMATTQSSVGVAMTISISISMAVPGGISCWVRKEATSIMSMMRAMLSGNMPAKDLMGSSVLFPTRFRRMSRP
nr:hypothetical protein [Shinella kummerowiae]